MCAEHRSIWLLLSIKYFEVGEFRHGFYAHQDKQVWHVKKIAVLK